MLFNSTVTKTSQKFPDVTFTYRAITEGLRARLDMALADPIAEVRSIQIELAGFSIDGSTDAKLSFQDMVRVNALADKLSSIRRNKLNPAYFDTCFVRVEGLVIDANPHDGEVSVITDGAKIRDFGPPELYQEIVAAILADARLTSEDKENLESPTTSTAEAGGQTSSSTAEPAVAKDTTNDATAVVTSPTT